MNAYPAIFRLLMDREARAEAISTLPKSALAMTTLPSIGREYSWEEIAIMTRAAPARLLGLQDRGTLAPGAVADVAVYRKQDDIAAMLGAAAYVFKDGDLVVEEGRVTHYRWGKALRLATRVEAPMHRRMEAFYQERYGLSLDWFAFPDSAIARDEPFAEVACRS